MIMTSHNNYLLLVHVYDSFCVFYTSKPPFMSECNAILLAFSVVLVWIAIVGDITPSDGISKSEKSRREQEALDYMCKLLGGGSRGKPFLLWMLILINMGLVN